MVAIGAYYVGREKKIGMTYTPEEPLRLEPIEVRDTIATLRGVAKESRKPPRANGMYV